MRNPFRSQYKITQEFANNPAYYGQFGLKGHEGIDLIPSGSVWDVLCLADGVVVTDSDNPVSGAYGVFVTVWHPKLKKATQYCHFKENYVKNGDVVTAGQKLGLMGKTGNTQGAHLHLNLYETDDNGIRLNKDNGYNGGINPKPFLEAEDQLPVNDQQSIIDQLRADRDKNWQLYQQEQQAKILLEDAVTQKQKAIDVITKENLELKERLDTLTQEKEDLSVALHDLQVQTIENKKIYEKLKMDYDIMKAQRKDIGKFTSEELRAELKGRSNINFLLKLFL